MSVIIKTDEQGTIWGYADANSTIVAQFEYDAWGNILSATSSVPVLVANLFAAGLSFFAFYFAETAVGIPYIQLMEVLDDAA